MPALPDGRGLFWSPPAIASSAPNTFDIFGVDWDGQVRHLRWDGISYTAWEVLDQTVCDIDGSECAPVDSFKAEAGGMS